MDLLKNNSLNIINNMANKKGEDKIFNIKDLLQEYIGKIQDTKYNLIYGTKMEGGIQDRETINTLSVCGKQISEKSWEFFILECLLDCAYHKIKVTKTHPLKKLSQVIVPQGSGASIQVVIETKAYTYSFLKKKPRDAMLWTLLTLYFKCMGENPLLWKN